MFNNKVQEFLSESDENNDLNNKNLFKFHKKLSDQVRTKTEEAGKAFDAADFKVGDTLYTQAGSEVRVIGRGLKFSKKSGRGMILGEVISSKKYPHSVGTKTFIYVDMLSYDEPITENFIGGNTSGVVGFGSGNAASSSTDTYAPGDNRLPSVIGKKKGKKKIHIQRRPLIKERCETCDLPVQVLDDSTGAYFNITYIDKEDKTFIVITDIHIPADAKGATKRLFAALKEISSTTQYPTMIPAAVVQSDKRREILKKYGFEGDGDMVCTCGLA